MISSYEYVKIIVTLFEAAMHACEIFSGNYRIARFFGGHATNDDILLET